MLLLGIDLGTSSVKVTVMDAGTLQVIAAARYPETEAPIISLQAGWAEQDPEQWWKDVQQAILLAHATGKYDPKDIGAIGISYQMHGLVLVDEKGNSLRNSIIWCDSRAVPYGEQAFQAIGEEKCLTTLLNSPGNFTAAKLAWVKDHEPAIYQRSARMMLPGDFIAFKLTNTITTSPAALSEGVLWDFRKGSVSQAVINHFGFDKDLIPAIQDVFSTHGMVTGEVAASLKLRTGIPVTYKAGDQPNNALSLNVMRPGEVAATAGTSGVIYGVTDKLVFDKQSRLNSFAHVNHCNTSTRTGVLLCINGCGIMNRMVRQLAGAGISYETMNEQAAGIPVGSDGLTILPFGNGAERMLNNKMAGSHIHYLDLNKHTPAHFYRAGQEGIAFAFRYGFDIMKENGMHPAVIRAGRANMFLSTVFTEAFVNATGVPVELYEADGSAGAALGAGIGVQYLQEADLKGAQKKLAFIEPAQEFEYEEAYQRWLHLLQRQLI